MASPSDDATTAGPARPRLVHAVARVSALATVAPLLLAALAELEAALREGRAPAPLPPLADAAQAAGPVLAAPLFHLAQQLEALHRALTRA